MKVLNNEQVLSTFQHQSKTNVQPSIGKEFSAILKDTVENTTAPTLTPTQTLFTSPLSGLKPVSSSSSDAPFAADSIEDMINLLDRYRNKLADPQITLKQLDPDIVEMSQKIDNLAPVLESLPADDGLRNILNRTMVTISLEISKFYRGDYISS